MGKEEKVKKVKNGFGLRLAQAIIWAVFVVAMLLSFGVNCVIYISQGEGIPEGLMPVFDVSLVYLVITIIGFITAFRGRTHRGANILHIIINAPFIVCIIGIFGVIGGALGAKSLKPKKAPKQATTAETADLQVAESDGESVCEETEAASAEQSEIKEPSKVWKWVFFGVMTAWYLFLLVASILSVAAPEKGYGWGPYDDLEYTRLMNLVGGFIIMLTVPSYGYFLAFRGPFDWSKKVRTIVVLSCIGITVIGDVLFYILIAEEIVKFKVLFRLSAVIAELGLLIIYLLGFLRIAPEKLQKKEYKKKGNIADLAIGIFYAFWNFCKKLLSIRNSTGFIVGGTILFTVMIFDALELLVTLFGIAVVLMFIVVVSSLYTPEIRRTFKVPDTSGSLRSLNYSSYDSFRGEDIYEDELGRKWATRNEGKTFYPINANNDRVIEEEKESSIYS